MPNHFYILTLVQFSHLLFLRQSYRGCNPGHREDFTIVVKQGVVYGIFPCNICFKMTIIGHIITALILYANPQAVNHCWMIHSESTGRLHVFIQLKHACSTASCFLSTDYDEEHLAPLSDTLNDRCRAAIFLADNDFPLHLVPKCANNEDAGRKKHLS